MIFDSAICSGYEEKQQNKKDNIVKDVWKNKIQNTQNIENTIQKQKTRLTGDLSIESSKCSIDTSTSPNLYTSNTVILPNVLKVSKLNAKNNTVLPIVLDTETLLS